VSQLANTSCNKAQSAVRQGLSALSQHSVSTLSALCQRYVWTLSAFKQYSESLSGLFQSLSGLGQHYQNRVRVMSGVVWGVSGVVWGVSGLCQHFVSTFSPNSTCSTEQLAVCVDKK
jgi:hypothetical protein